MLLLRLVYLSSYMIRVSPKLTLLRRSVIIGHQHTAVIYIYILNFLSFSSSSVIIIVDFLIEALRQKSKQMPMLFREHLPNPTM